jgi:hypothetical protein
MLYQMREYREKGMPGIILHGRYGLETPYLGPAYLERIKFAVEEAEKLGLQTWIYDEMNWPSGTADKRVLAARPDLAQRYIECINLSIRGPWFTYLTGADSRYLDFERSTPVAAFAIGEGQVIDLTPNLSFQNVIPWEAPAGNWRLVYLVEKIADYYIDSLNPESTAEFLRIGYDPYAQAVDGKLSSQMLGFYTDEPAMHYFLTGGDNPVVPWTKDMFRRFQERNGYNLRPRLPDLFFDITPDSARVRYDFYTTLTEFYSQAYYRQIHEWCQEHQVLFTGHMLYEDWLRALVRVEGNLYKHYAHMDVIGVDHLYPIIGTRDRPGEHVAIKVGSSAAHQYGSPRLLCESFGGIFMDATMQRMKWITDWEYVLGVNLLNPHGFHYTLEGPRKRDWPPSQFYQYPWWQYYGEFSHYVSRLSHLLSGGRHIARAALIYPINAMFAAYVPQTRTALANRIENDFNTLTDLLLRVHYDYDYLDEDLLAGAEILPGGGLRVGDEVYELLVLPPAAHIKLSTVETLEKFMAAGGRALGSVILPDKAFGHEGEVTELVDVSRRMAAIFGVDPAETQRDYRQQLGIEVAQNTAAGGGKAVFLRTYALTRQLPLQYQRETGSEGQPESPYFVIAAEDGFERYFFTSPDGGAEDRIEISAEVRAEREAVAGALQSALESLLPPDVSLDNREVFYLHREKDGQDIYFLVNPTFSAQTAVMSIQGEVEPELWDPSTGLASPIIPSQVENERTRFTVHLPPVGSAFILPQPSKGMRIVDTNLTVDRLENGEGRALRALAYGPGGEGYLVVEREGRRERLAARAEQAPQPLILDGVWDFEPEGPNALVIGEWMAAPEAPGLPAERYAGPEAPEAGWLRMVPGAWSYQLPAEPEAPYPIPVWYRIKLQAGYLPPQVDLIVDGFAGSEWRLFVNGKPVESTPVRSKLDSQMKAVEIGKYLALGENLIALRLVLTSATDGLTDLLKIQGEFSLAPQGQGSYRIAAPVCSLQPEPWTGQGYPFYSGAGTYRQRFELPAEFLSQRVFVKPEMTDDVLEVRVNGQPAAIRLWAPYEVEITSLLQPGQNTLELRAANTLVNLLEATPRPSGLAGPARLIAYRPYTFELGEEQAGSAQRDPARQAF